MEPVLKLILFSIIFFSMVIGFYKTYKYYNEKITGASGWGVFGFALLLILLSAVLFVGGLYLLITVFVYLAEQG